MKKIKQKSIQKKKSPLQTRFRSYFRWLSFFKFTKTGLVITFLFAITLSLLNVTRASAPIPGHTWSEMGDVAVTVAQGGTGVATLSSGDLVVGAGTSAVTATSTLAVNKGGTGAATFTANDILVGNGTSAFTSTSTVAVNEGGTGASSHTANNVLIGNGTSPLTSIAPGTSGNVLTSNGTTWASSARYGYSINVQALTSSPADAGTVYFGTLPKAPVAAAATSKVYIRKAGTIKIAEIYVYSGTAGTNENWSLYIRLNNTTDTLIATVGANTNERVFSNTGLSIAVSAGDYIEIKGIQPTWATNPLTTIYGGYIYVE
jgi:hypothetical protein